MPSRKVIDLDPKMQPLAMLFATRMAETGIPFMYTSTRRTQEEQDELFAKGRTTPGPMVTWTRHSKHIDGLAFDIAILKDGKPTWDAKVNVNNDSLPDYAQAGEIGEKIGLKWGGKFKTRDLPHFEWREQT